MKLVQYWIRRKLSSFSLFGWFLVGTSSFKDFGLLTLPIKDDDEEDFRDTAYDGNHIDGDVNDNVTMNMRLMMRMITSIKYSAGLSRGPGPIRNCISSP